MIYDCNNGLLFYYDENLPWTHDSPSLQILNKVVTWFIKEAWQLTMFTFIKLLKYDISLSSVVIQEVRVDINSHP